MNRRPIIPLGTPERPRSPVPIEPIETDRPGPLGDRLELAILALFAGGLVVQGCCPW